MTRGTIRRRASVVAGIPPLEAIIDGLDVGVLVCALESGRVRFANAEGATALRALGATGRQLPAAVRRALGGAALPADRFSAAVEVEGPGGQRYFVRARQVRGAGATLVMVSAARLRVAEFGAHLRDHVGLTCRQSQCVALVHAGLRNRVIAERLSISEGRVEQHLVEVYQALGVTSRTALAVRLGEIVEELASGARRDGGTAASSPARAPGRRRAAATAAPRPDNVAGGRRAQVRPAVKGRADDGA